MENATLEQYLQIGQMIKSGAIDRKTAQMIIERRIVDAAVSMVTVTSLTSREAVNVVRDQTGCITNEGIFPHQEVIVVPGKYKCLLTSFGKSVSSEHVSEYFAGLGYHGDAGAFLAWIAQVTPDGYFATIPLKGAAALSFHGRRPERYLRSMAKGNWRSRWNFVAFQKIG